MTQIQTNLFWPPLNQKGPPLWWKIWNFFRMLILIAQKKRLGALNATQKTIGLCQVLLLNFFLSKNARFWDILVFFLDFLSNGTWQRLVVFCVAFSAPRRFFWAIKIKIRKKFQIVHHKRPFWLRRGRNKLVRIYVILPRKQEYFWNP